MEQQKGTLMQLSNGFSTFHIHTSRGNVIAVLMSDDSSSNVGTITGDKHGIT